MSFDVGRLSPVPLREVWLHEARSFSQWLLANADVLGEALGIDVELSEAEYPVGGYSLDLLGKDMTHGGPLIVENQLEGTDHDHLGKIITYAAGSDASTVVWLASQFREEHRQALDWLNTHTDEGVRFFGVVVKAVRIDASRPAPLFDVIASPNDWQKQVRTATQAEGTTGGMSRHYLQFWARFLDRMHREHPGWSRARTPSKDNWIMLRSPIKGTVYEAVVGGRRRRLRADLYLDGGPGSSAANLARFRVLLAHRAAMEAASEFPLVFDEMEGSQAARVAIYHEDADITDAGRHDEFIDWLFAALTNLRAAVAAVPKDAWTVVTGSTEA